LKVTVYGFENPTTRPPPTYPPISTPGAHWSVLDAQVCAGSSDFQVNPYGFSLVDTANQPVNELDIGPGPFKPMLDITTLTPGECTRGLVVFEVPPNTVIKTIRWEYPYGGDALRWAL
jgi:hypothetical protein